MKLRRIRLEGVRRFAGPVEVTGFGEGINLLAAPNEAGKSTIFEALSAAFFLPFGSWSAQVRRLQPYAGGDPAVEVEVEVPQGVFTVAKTWSAAAGRRSARITQGGRLVAQADAAEAWIADRVQAPGDGGPAGLLWVRQGEALLDRPGEAAAQRAASASARRGLLASVTGEVEVMTGGRRMELARARVEEDLAALVTSRGPRKGGALDDAERALAELSAREADLQARAGALRCALDRRRALRREVQALEDPQSRQVDATLCREAEAALESAQRHAERLDTARARAEGAAIRHEATGAAIAALQAALAERDEAVRIAAQAEETDADSAAAAARAASQAEMAAAAAATARRARDAVAGQLRRAVQAESAAAAQTLRGELAERIARGAAQEKALAAARAAAETGPDEAQIAALDTHAAALQAAELAETAAAPVVILSYEGDRRARLDGAVLEDGVRHALPRRAVLELEGVGRLTVEPGRADAAARASEARKALDAALARAGFETIAAARAAAQARRTAAAERDARARSFAAEFPAGLGPLRLRMAELPEPAEPAPDAPPRAAAEAALQVAETDLSKLEAAARIASDRAAEARGGAGQAAERLAAARDRLTRAKALLARHGDPATALAEALTRQTREDTARREAAAAAAALERDAPDLQAADLRVQRLRAAQAQIAGQIADLREALAGLEGQIGSAAEAGIDEELADTARQRRAAEARRDALRFEVAVLTRLQSALEAARAQARDTYVAPVLAELRPLLAQVLPGADLALDADAVLPSELHRNGQGEPVEGLSGGTREQIALLVRLAFARMLARAGRAAPVILDDAIVFTDDARIERMFDALSRQAQDVQIIVLTCRQSAFRTLAAHRLVLGPPGRPERR